MARYLSKVLATLDKLNKWAIKRISGTENVQADALARIVATFRIKGSSIIARLPPNYIINNNHTCMQHQWNKRWLDAWDRNLPPNKST